MRLIALAALLGLLSSPALAQITGPDDETAGCPLVPLELTNDRFYFLSEIGGCCALQPFLAQVQSGLQGDHALATLIIDEACTLRTPLVLPARMTLAGVGIAGAGQLSFDIPDGAAAISLPPGTAASVSGVMIRDLSIWGPDRGHVGPVTNGAIGVDLSRGSIPRMEQVRISRFGVGLHATDAYSGLVSSCNISDNGINVRLASETYAWRLRDDVLSQARTWGLAWTGGNDLLLDGLRMEGNGSGGVLVRTYGARISNTRFEGNGPGGAIRLEPGAASTRVFGNLLSGNGAAVVDGGTDTRCLMNVTDVALSCESP